MTEIKSYFLGFGGNQGQVEQTFIRAIKKLAHSIGTLEAVSSIYISEALQVDYSIKQDDYLNCVALFRSDKSESEVFNIISKLEIDLGRVRVEKWGPRIIDIDIIAVDNLNFSSSELNVPHAEMHKRSFVLLPFAEIARNWQHPVFKKTVQQLIADLVDPKSCRILTSFPPDVFE